MKNNIKKSVFRSEEGRNEILSQYRAKLQNFSIASTKEVFTTLGKTFIIESGMPTAPTLIFLHGSGSNSTVWLRDIEELSKDYHIYAIDILGEPGLSEEIQYPLQQDEYTEWLLEIMSILSIEKAVFIGISLGGFLATKLAVAHPQVVNKLILISPSGIGRQKQSFLFYAIVYSIFGSSGTKRLYHKINGGIELPASILKDLLAIRKYFLYRTDTIPIFTDQQLHKLTMPIALIVGDNDIMLDSAHTQLRLSAIANQLTTYLVSGGGHSLGPQYSRISDFLKL